MLSAVVRGAERELWQASKMHRRVSGLVCPTTVTAAVASPVSPITRISRHIHITRNCLTSSAVMRCEPGSKRMFGPALLKPRLHVVCSAPVPLALVGSLRRMSSSSDKPKQEVRQ